MAAIFLISRKRISRQFPEFHKTSVKLCDFKKLIVLSYCIFEILVALFVPKRIFANYFSNTDHLNVHKALILSFVIIVLLTNSSFSNLYTYRSSSFIWTICIIYLGLYFLNNKELEKYFLFIFLPIPFINFLFATGFYRNIIMDFYIKFSDKFQFIKASDLFLTVIVVNILFFKIKGFNRNTILYLVITTGIYFPLMLFNSRGAFISLALYSRQQFIFLAIAHLVILIVN